ncbi:hypothetical protein AGRA3207_001793 [Actinomadura graeca]|uniref:DUF4190 domain-containing protein n=1 Tax=Actinomadura graeca TaxID=2750812 RepID=A0ABX8QQC4_9ACTN|nr:hypothetical protein [Actinomadura graeca]QXJ20990.1 hypothetical protein AGRA3207_001793 [Actinomadura graeca]
MYEAVPHQPAAQPAPAARPALGIGPDGTYTLGGQIAAFVLGLLTMIVCLPLVVVAALLYTSAENRFAEHDLRRGRVLVIWSWLCITVLPLLVTGTVLLIVTVIRSAVG